MAVLRSGEKSGYNQPPFGVETMEVSRMFKKLIAILFVVSAIGVVTAGCSGGDAADGEGATTPAATEEGS